MHTQHAYLMVFAGLLISAIAPAQSLAQLPAGHWGQLRTHLEPGNTVPCCLPEHAGVGNCALAAKHWSYTHASDAPDGDLLIYLRSDGQGGADLVKAVGSTCPLDARDETVVALQLDAAAQAALLDRVAQAGNRPARSGAVAALALSAGTPAFDALARLAAPGGAAELRRDALFWLGVARGAAAVPLLQDQLARKDEPASVQQHTVFALSQNRTPAADHALEQLTRAGTPQNQRAEALFWLGQTRPATAAPILQQALTDPAAAIREKAVFALSQLPPEDAVPTLTRISRDRSLPADTRRQAVFWLGQLDHPEAAAALEALLGVR